MTRDDSFSIGFYLDKNPRHVRVGEGRQHNTHVTLIGTAQELHGPSGCCTCCHGRATGKASTLAAVNAAAPEVPFGAITPEEWATFTQAVRSVVGADGRVHQSDVRPLIRGRIQPSHIGACYSRAKSLGLLKRVGKEPSSDREGRNTHHDSPIYELRSAA